MYKSYIERNNSACSLVLQTGKIARKKGEKERGEGAGREKRKGKFKCSF